MAELGFKLSYDQRPVLATKVAIWIGNDSSLVEIPLVYGHLLKLHISPGGLITINYSHVSLNSILSDCFTLSSSLELRGI